MSSLDQVLTSLNSVYQPQIDSVQQQRAALPAQFDAQAQGIDASKNNAFNSILDGARARGTGVAFGGIPLQEQATYTAGTYAPALANLRTAQDQQSKSLTDTLNGINQQKYTQAVGIDQYNQTMAENQRQFNANQAFQQQQLAASKAAAGGGFSPSYGGGPAVSAPAGPTGGSQPQFIGNNDLRGHLAYLAQNGNADAKIALQYVGNDGKYNISPFVTNPNIIAALDRIGATNVYQVQSPAPKVSSSKSNTNQYGGSTAGLARF